MLKHDRIQATSVGMTQVSAQRSERPRRREETKNNADKREPSQQTHTHGITSGNKTRDSGPKPPVEANVRRKLLLQYWLNKRCRLYIVDMLRSPPPRMSCTSCDRSSCTHFATFHTDHRHIRNNAIRLLEGGLQDVVCGRGPPRVGSMHCAGRNAGVCRYRRVPRRRAERSKRARSMIRAREGGGGGSCRCRSRPLYLPDV